MLLNIFQQLENELIDGCKKNGHPFRFFSFGTYAEKFPSLRTVVLRKVQDDLSLIFYADVRSEKIRQIQANLNCCALFYHPGKMIQVKVEGIAEINSEDIDLEEIWKSIPNHSKKDYTTISDPGSKLNQPEDVQYLDRSNNFCTITIKPQRFEYLKIGHPNHTRAEFIKDNLDWKGQFLVP